MPTLLRRSWDQTPILGSTLNRGHPIAKEIGVCTVGVAELTRGFSPIATAVGATEGPGPGGVGWRFPAASLNRVQYVFPSNAFVYAAGSATAPWTIRARFTETAFASLSLMCGWGPYPNNTVDSGTTRGLLFYPDNHTITPWDNIAAPAFATSNMASLAVCDVIATYDGANQRVFLNGIQQGATTAQSWGAITSTNLGWWVGGRHSAGTTSFAGTMYHTAWWNRCLRVEEVEQLAAEPYAFITPPGPKILYFDLSTSSGPSNVTGSASISGTGIVAATGVRTRIGTAALAGTGTLVTTGVRTRLATAALSGTGVVNATATRKTFGSVTILGTGIINAETPATADPYPISITIRDQGHTVGIRDRDHNLTIRDSGHTVTAREQA